MFFIVFLNVFQSSVLKGINKTILIKLDTFYKKIGLFDIENNKKTVKD